MPRYCPNPECPGLVRDGVVPEYVDAVSRCLDCGEGTIFGDGRLAALADRPEVEYHELATVFRAMDLAQGQLVAGVMEAAGIPVYVKGEFLQGAIGELPATVTQVEVQVPLDRADQAREIVRPWESASGEGVEEAEALGEVVARAIEEEEAS